MAKASASKLLFKVSGPLPAKVYRGKFEPYASTKFIDTAALKKTGRAVIECGTLDIAGHCVTLVAETRKGVITEIRPSACKSCAPKKGRKQPSKPEVKRLVGLVNQKLADLKIKQPEWPVGQPIARKSLGFRIPFGPIIVIIGTDPDEGVFTSDICIVINTKNGSCIYCIIGPNACVEL